MDPNSNPNPYPYTTRKFPKFNWCQWEHPLNWITPIEMEAFVDRQLLALKAFIKPGDVVVDVGAFTGDTTMAMAILAGKTGLCLAFEPNPFAFKALCENAVINSDLCNIVPFNYAVGMPDKIAVFHYCDKSLCNGGRLLLDRPRKIVHNHPLAVKCINLSEVLASINISKLSFVKSDTEGFDLSVFESIKNELAASRCVVQAEIFPDLNDSEKGSMVDFMAGLGFNVHDIESVKQTTKEDVVGYKTVRDVYFLKPQIVT